MEEYHGIVIDKSLKDKKLLKKLNVIGSKKSDSGDWMLLKISFPKNKLGEMIEFIQGGLVSNKKYYVHFYRDNEVIVIFKDMVFRVTTEKSSWGPIIDYGLSLGIPREQLDMKPCRIEDEIY